MTLNWQIPVSAKCISTSTHTVLQVPLVPILRYLSHISKPHANPRPLLTSHLSSYNPCTQLLLDSLSHHLSSLLLLSQIGLASTSMVLFISAGTFLDASGYFLSFIHNKNLFLIMEWVMPAVLLLLPLAYDDTEHWERTNEPFPKGLSFS